MGMVVQHNMNALNAYNKLNTNVAGLKKSSEKLSSGYRINRAGDDAAGLAISEKMRSQIRGLNQAKRNSQDGISMIQTFEGAAQESHAILQRMKELAAESSNGTYDNATDRAAIQLEFDQLNDELNQIADTDFNGTIVLNGGQMADGLKQVDGEFNYANFEREAKQLSSKDITLVDQQKFNDSKTHDATKGDSTADFFWNDLNANWKRGDAATANDGPDSVDITFKYDEKGGADGKTFWTAVSANNGADVSKVTVVAADGTTAGGTKNGGFAVKGASADVVADVVLDQTKLVNGDTVTITFNNPVAGKSAPTNAGADITSTAGVKQGSAATDFKISDLNLNVKVGAAGTDANMNEGLNALYNTLNGATVDVTYEKATGFVADKIVLTGKDPDGSTVEFTSTAADSDNTKITITNGGKSYDFGVKYTADTGKIEFCDWDTTGAGKAGSNVYLEISPEKANNDVSKTNGTVKYKINIENNKFDADAKPNVEVKEPVNSEVSNSNSFTNSTARMTYTDHIVLQTGARTKDSVDFTFNYNSDKTADMGNLKANLNISARADGLNTENLSLATADDANYAIDQIDKAINKVSMVRASFGSIQNRLEHKIENLTTTNENLTEAESGIRDTDMAQEMLNYTKYNVLQQAAQSMLAQANQQPQSILQLLG